MFEYCWILTKGLSTPTVFNKNNLDPSAYPKTKLTEQYSSDKVDLLSKDELKHILLKENLV